MKTGNGEMTNKVRNKRKNMQSIDKAESRNIVMMERPPTRALTC